MVIAVLGISFTNIAPLVTTSQIYKKNANNKENRKTKTMLAFELCEPQKNCYLCTVKIMWTRARKRPNSKPQKSSLLAHLRAHKIFKICNFLKIKYLQLFDSRLERVHP